MEYAYLYAEPPRVLDQKMKPVPEAKEGSCWVVLWDDGEDQKDQKVIIIQL